MSNIFELIVNDSSLAPSPSLDLVFSLSNVNASPWFSVLLEQLQIGNIEAG